MSFKICYYLFIINKSNAMINSFKYILPIFILILSTFIANADSHDEKPKWDKLCETVEEKYNMSNKFWSIYGLWRTENMVFTCRRG